MNRTKLEKLSVRGFKTIRELTDFEPTNLTILIGPNGAGKSNFISFFRMMSWILTPPGQLQLYVAEQGGANALLYNGSRTTPQLSATFRFARDNSFSEYEFRLFHAAGDTLIYAEEKFRFRKKEYADRPAPGLGAGHREPELLAKAAQDNQTARIILDTFRRMVVHQFHNTSVTARIRGKWSESDNRFLKEDAANIAPFLLRIRDRHPQHYSAIEETIRLILPFFGSFELYGESDSVLLRWRERGSDQIFDASQASDGMLRIIALVALLRQPEADLPNVLILDEPELGLHPFAIEVLAGLLESAAKSVQVIVATQSVSLIDRMSPNNIVVVERGDTGTTFKRLDEDGLEAWLGDYTLSELWEKNVVGGRPH